MLLERDIPDQNPLLPQLPTVVKLWTYLVIHIEQLLQRLALRWHDEANNVHEQSGHRITIEHNCQDPLHYVHFRIIISLLKLCLQLLDGRLICCIVLVDQTMDGL